MKAQIYTLLAKYQEELDNTKATLRDADTDDDQKYILQGASQAQERIMLDLLQLVSP